MASAQKALTRVIGIDPGLNATGYGVIECRRGGVKLIEAGVIRMPRSRGDNLPARLEMLFEQLREVMEEFRPQAMCLEAARLESIPVVSFPAKRVKQSVTGNGNASKTQVQRAVQHFFSLERTPQPPDVADALAVALCFVNTRRASTDGWR